MTFTDAAVEVLRQLGKPLHYKEITDFAIERNLLSVVGKSPDVTMGARLAALMKKETPDCPLVRVKQGVYALRDWDEKTIRGENKKGKKAKADVSEQVSADEETDTQASNEDAADEDASEDAHGDAEPTPMPDDDDDELLIAPAAPPAAAASRGATARRADVEERAPDAPDERFRREILASAADMFEEEDDDDQPILGGPGPDGRPAVEGAEGDGRRRRRRRRRGRGPGTEGATSGGSGLPSYTATPVDAVSAGRDSRGGEAQRDRDRGDRDGRDGHRGEGRDSREGRGDGYRVHDAPRVDHLAEGAPSVDDLGGRDFADAVFQILMTFDRNLGPVSLRQITETAQRRGKVQGDTQQVQSMVAATVRADNSRRLAAGTRPRFRFVGGRVGLTDWSLAPELLNAEADAIAAVEKYRELARRSFARKIGELPGHAFVELCIMALERSGASQIRAIRRPGAPGFEAHFSALLKTPADEIRIAIVIRKDGREVGRERVTDLRGALHHYGNGVGAATMGWLFTSGQVLSGAREEAGLANASPVSLTDGFGLAKLCEDFEIATIKAKMPIAIPDIDLLEALRAS